MKKLLAMLLVLAMISCLFVACANNDSETDAPTTAPTDESKTNESTDNSDATEPDDNNGDVKIAMITDYGDITDQSFNQTTYEACQKFAGDNGYDFKYYKPTDNSTAGRVASTELAIADGYNVIVMPGYAFGGTIVEVAPQYPNVKFIALDVAKGDLLEAAVANAGETYDYNPDNWNLADYVDLSNVYCAVYQEELSGYMAGYAAVCLGYTKLGFLGGTASCRALTPLLLPRVLRALRSTTSTAASSTATATSPLLWTPGIPTALSWSSLAAAASSPLLLRLLRRSTARSSASTPTSPLSSTAATAKA